MQYMIWGMVVVLSVSAMQMEMDPWCCTVSSVCC
jgi:hypothetical protein